MRRPERAVFSLVPDSVPTLCARPRPSTTEAAMKPESDRAWRVVDGRPDPMVTAF